MSLLRAEEITVGYGRGDIVHGASVTAESGEIVTIIGPNGAGKSTLIKAIAGLLRPRLGQISVGDDRIEGLRASEVARRGVAFVPQEANVFRQLTVGENLEMGAWTDRAALRERREQVLTLFPALRDRTRTRAGNLSGGQRQMVAFGMALMVAPRVLLLDEPSAGLSPAMVETMFGIIQTVNASGVAVLMVEQNAIQALRISARGYVMAAGQVVLEGPATELLESEEISELYLGSRE